MWHLFKLQSGLNNGTSHGPGGIGSGSGNGGSGNGTSGSGNGGIGGSGNSGSSGVGSGTGSETGGMVFSGQGKDWLIITKLLIYFHNYNLN